MERKQFFAAAAAVGASLAAAGIATGSSVYTPMPGGGATPYPSGSPRRRGERGSAKNLEHIHRALEHAIDSLQHDQADYGGHRVKAIEFLEQARTEIVAALAWDQAHPNTAATPH